MPNPQLTEQINSLIEVLNQRRRSSENLMKGLKAASDALNKANRALGDYAQQNINLDARTVEQSKETLETLPYKEQVYDTLQADLRREAKALANQLKALKDANTALEGEIVDLIKLDNAYQNLQKSPFQDEQLTALMPALAQELEEGQARLSDEFGAALRDALAEMGIQIGGRPPRFEIGRFEITANFFKRTASISYGKIELVPRVKLSLDSLIKSYQSEQKNIEARKEDGTRWIEQFYRAWEIVQLKEAKKSSRVNIVDCYYEMVLLRQKRNFAFAPSKGLFVDYNRAQFAYDFYEFTNRQRLQYNGLTVAAHTAVKAEAESSSRSIWIVEGSAPHDGRFIAGVAFVKD